VGAELFHADERTVRQTDGHDEANCLFRNFANALNGMTRISIADSSWN